MRCAIPFPSPESINPIVKIGSTRTRGCGMFRAEPESPMPSTRIETTSGWITDHATLIAAVQDAIIEGIRIPPGDRDIRLLEYPAHSFAAPHGKGPRYTVVEMSMFTGRSLEAKRRLYAALATTFESFGVPRGDLKVFIHEVDRVNWGLGGKAATDIELGFKIDA